GGSGDARRGAGRLPPPHRSGAPDHRGRRRRAGRRARVSTIRIVGGVWRRTPLVVADRPGLRPTPDRVRETLFNWLGQDLAGRRVLDAFAGSGALGLEAASRGARRVVMVESDRAAALAIARLLERLRGSADPASRTAAEAVELRRQDVRRALPAPAAAGR